MAREMPEIDVSLEALAKAPLARLADESELAVVKRLAAWPRTLEGAALAHEPHRIAFYLYDLASAFHLLWNKGKEDSALRFIVTDDPALTRARMALIRAVALVIAAGLALMGVEPVEEMR
jgi:arginyl-tRNA synthetase